MPLCPVHLTYCDRQECAAGICEQCGEAALHPCTGCGTLIVVRGLGRAGVCVDCIDTEFPEAEAT